jgi:hypothetical protein
MQGGNEMWLRRKKRPSRLSRQLALAQLEDALARVAEDQRYEKEFEAGHSEAEQPDARPPSAVPPNAGHPGPVRPRASESEAGKAAADESAADLAAASVSAQVPAQRDNRQRAWHAWSFFRAPHQGLGHQARRLTDGSTGRTWLD